MSRRALGWLGLALVVAGVVGMLVGAAMLGGRAYPWLPPDIHGTRPQIVAPGSGWPEHGWGAALGSGSPLA